MSRADDPKWLTAEWYRTHRHDPDGRTRLYMWQLDRLAAEFDEPDETKDETEPSKGDTNA